MASSSKGFVAQPTESYEIHTTDERDMLRMGRVQQLKRYFGPWGLMGFACVTGAVWQYVLLTLIWSLPNGGPSGALYMFIVCAIGLMLNALSLAEMASMFAQPLLAPTFSSSLIRDQGTDGRRPVPLDLGVCAEVGLASVCYLTALQIQGLVILRHPEFAFENWHSALMTVAVALTAVLFNTFLVAQLPLLEFVMLVLHVAAFFVFLFVLAFMGPSSTAKEVFDSWENANGIIAPVTTLTSADSICHLAEELKDASKWLPRIMVGAAACNFTIGFILLVIILFRLGDVDAAIASPTGQPYIAVLLNATQSVPGTAVLVAYIVLALIFCATNVVTTSSRQLFSFARDRGVPFSAWLSQVSSQRHIPAQAIVCTIMITVVLSLILIGSSLAFNIIASLFGVALMSSYLVSISTLVYQRYRGNRLPRTRFSLGHAGLWVNIATICFDAFVLVVMFFPPAPNPDAQTMNWACLIFGAVVLFALGSYVARTKHTYTAPVEATRAEEDVFTMMSADAAPTQRVFEVHPKEHDR